MLKRPTRDPRPPARRAYAPEGTEKRPIVFRSIGVMQRSHINNMVSRKILFMYTRQVKRYSFDSLIITLFHFSINDYAIPL
ncbi:MAG: hypothetical protein R6T98_16605 [Desulfatiglandales bacterium]